MPSFFVCTEKGFGEMLSPNNNRVVCGEQAESQGQL